MSISPLITDMMTVGVPSLLPGKFQSEVLLLQQRKRNRVVRSGYKHLCGLHQGHLKNSEQYNSCKQIKEYLIALRIIQQKKCLLAFVSQV